MKRKICFIICGIMLTLSVAGCSQDTKATAKGATGPSTVEDVIKQQMEAEQNKVSPTEAPETLTKVSVTPVWVSEPDSAASVDPEPASTEPEKTDPKEVISEETDTNTYDIDLTTMSSTMIYSEVYNIMMAPSDYIGKTIKMRGTFTAFNDENTGKRYFTCIIRDATACCAQGIEFEPTDKYIYPDDFPKDGDDITVAGTFDTYVEDGCMYCTLRNADILK